eukprot:8002835-Heterocapsa_arctica.AAC.1
MPCPSRRVAGEEQALLLGRDAFDVPDHRFHVVRGDLAKIDVQRDGLESDPDVEHAVDLRVVLVVGLRVVAL